MAGQILLLNVKTEVDKIHLMLIENKEKYKMN